MTIEPNIRTIQESIRALEGIRKEDLSGYLLGYVTESDHQGWEGWSLDQEDTIRKFLDDLTTYIEVIENDGKVSQDPYRGTPS